MKCSAVYHVYPEGEDYLIASLFAP
jgi:hypothetical protein